MLRNSSPDLDETDVTELNRPDHMQSSAKQLVRERVHAQVRAIPAKDRATLSQQLCGRIRSAQTWHEAHSVLLFSPLGDEPDISSLLDDALTQRKTIGFPRFDAAGAVYSAAQVASNADLAPGRFGVLEPHAGCPAVPLNQLDLVLVPGIAFDLAGRRLGRGKGFYDRLLAEVRGHKCGVAFDAQIVAEIPEEPHDVRVNSIVTPTRWVVCGVEG